MIPTLATHRYQHKLLLTALVPQSVIKRAQGSEEVFNGNGTLDKTIVDSGMHSAVWDRGDCTVTGIVV